MQETLFGLFLLVNGVWFGWCACRLVLFWRAKEVLQQVDDAPESTVRLAKVLGLNYQGKVRP